MKNRRRFRDQNYEKIRQSCLKTEHPFVDTTFPPNNTSLFLEQGRSSDIEWKRPKDLHDDPHLFVEGASANDVTQGILGNCWFVSACSALTHNQDLLDMVIPNAEDQEWSADKGYAGIFRFRFWRFGEWVEVVIDDLLPTRNGKLLFARSKTPNEFWSALLEKAFAKLYGCYENLVGGHLSDALQDVSGGVAQTINVGKYLKSDQSRLAQELFSHLSESFNSRALIVAAIAAKTKEEIEQTLDCGLVKGHAYAVTAIRSVELANKTSNSITNYLFGSNDCQKLIRLQNPWGEKEWNGSWSDNSPEWEQVGEKEKASLGITVDEDGEFWMSWESFIQYFTDISVCQLMNTGLFSMSKIYHEEILVSEWTTNGVKSGAPNDLAGGCLNFSATFCNNPQYLFHVSEPESDIMFALTQRDQSEGEKRRDPYVTIGMHVMRVESNRKHRLHQPMIAVGTSDYANARSAFLELRDLPVGNYVVLPTTFAPREQAQFMLRIYADHRINVKTLKKHSPSFGICGCKNATSVVRITIHDFKCSSVLNTYCILKNKKSLVRTATIKQSSHPKFEDQFVFHSSKVSDTFVIEVWEDRLLEKDRLIAFSSFPVAIDNDNRDLELDLKSGSEREAKVRLSISAFDDPMYL